MRTTSKGYIRMDKSDNSPEKIRYSKFMGLRPGQQVFIRTQFAIYQRIVTDYPKLTRAGSVVSTDKGPVTLGHEDGSTTLFVDDLSPEDKAFFKVP